MYFSIAIPAIQTLAGTFLSLLTITAYPQRLCLHMFAWIAKDLFRRFSQTLELNALFAEEIMLDSQAYKEESRMNFCPLL